MTRKSTPIRKKRPATDTTYRRQENSNRGTAPSRDAERAAPGKTDGAAAHASDRTGDDLPERRGTPESEGGRLQEGRPPASGVQRPLEEPLQKGDMVVVRMRSEWELEGELRAINDEVIRVFDFAVCDVLRLRRKDIERIERLVDAD